MMPLRVAMPSSSICLHHLALVCIVGQADAVALPVGPRPLGLVGRIKPGISASSCL